MSVFLKFSCKNIWWFRRKVVILHSLLRTAPRQRPWEVRKAKLKILMDMEVSKKIRKKVWWFEKFAVTLQNISALKIVEPCLKKANVSTLK